jgi:hypothetical protein
VTLVLINWRAAGNTVFCSSANPLLNGRILVLSHAPGLGTVLEINPGAN